MGHFVDAVIIVILLSNASANVYLLVQRFSAARRESHVSTV